MNVFKQSDYEYKILALRILNSEIFFAEHWETFVDCIENNGIVSND